MSEGFVDHRDELNRKLEKAIEKALYEAGEFVQGEAQNELQNSPARVDTGNLKNRIDFKLAQDPDNNNETCVVVGTNVYYGVYVHEGTGIYHPNGRKTPWRYKDAKGRWHTTRGMKANRFLKNAVSKNEKQIKQNIAASIRDDMR